uniref:Gap junction protein delta 4 n=1 Tax=Lepisosteus oculatus TaxID=7918 RepID=W5LWP5_LEPOC|nr:PREDICTED: gap junction delta-4 protein [Lepisosteus oculatus]
MGRWNTLDFLFITLNYNITIVGKIWLTLMIMLRFLVVLFAGYPLYQDEQERFVCNTIQPGCSNVCYDMFSPLSHFRFWLVQIITLCLPYAMFIIYVVHHISAEAAIDRCVSDRIKTTSHYKIHQETFRKASLSKIALEAEQGKIHSFLGAYIFHLLLRILLEAGFGAGQYYLFGFFIPKRYICYEMLCTSMVDCYVSRPTEKTVMLNFMFGVSALSFLLNIADLICVIKRSLRQKHKNKLLMEKMCEEEEYYLSPASANVDSHIQLTQELVASAAFHKRRTSKSTLDGAMSARLEEVDNSSEPSDVLSQRAAGSNTNSNNDYRQNQEEDVDQEGSEVALCMSELKGVPRMSGKYCKHGRLRPPPSLLRERVPAGEADISTDLCAKRIGQYTLVQMTTSDIQSGCSELQERRSEWV